MEVTLGLHFPTPHKIMTGGTEFYFRLKKIISKFQSWTLGSQEEEQGKTWFTDITARDHYNKHYYDEHCAIANIIL